MKYFNFLLDELKLQCFCVSSIGRGVALLLHGCMVARSVSLLDELNVEVHLMVKYIRCDFSFSFCYWKLYKV
jgi:hypothetical protein